MLITTICGRKKEIWTSRQEALDSFMEAILGTEGSEQERYVKIYGELLMGRMICTDEEN